MTTNLSSLQLTLLIVCIVLCVIIVICAGIIIALRIEKNKQVQKELDPVHYQPLDEEVARLKKLTKKYKNKILKYKDLNYDQRLKDMQTILDVELKAYKNEQLLQIDQDIQAHKNELLKHLLLNTMQPLHLKVINESSVHYLPIDEKYKPLLIGKKGANIKYLNELTNCNINVERDSKYVEISCPNPLDKQIAINTINHLIKSQAFDLNAISNVYKKEKRLIVKECIETGKKYLGILNIKNDSDELCEYVGRLKYRWSFSQNVLEHCYETALICEELAKQLGLDPDTAKAVGFFHDIGKSIDYEKRYDHIGTGVKIAKQCNLPSEVINAILKHHRTNCNEDYVLLVRCADAWSAARKGARHVPSANQEALINMVEAKIKKVGGIMKYKIDVDKNNINIIFIPTIPSKQNYQAIKYCLIKAIKDDVRLNKYHIYINN